MSREKKAVSPRVMEANRHNAEKSTGPRTVEGKKRSSRNSTRHGYYCADAEAFRELLGAWGEGPEEFDRLFAELCRRYRPEEGVEQTLVEEMTREKLKLAHLEKQEAALVRQDRQCLKAAQERWEHEFGDYPADFQATAMEVKDGGLLRTPDSGGKYLTIVKYLIQARKQLEQRNYANGESWLRGVYGELQPTWRGAEARQALRKLVRGEVAEGAEREALQQRAVSLVGQEVEHYQGALTCGSWSIPMGSAA